ncbi:MAG: hypothetical protein ACRDU5_15425 [Mycobacterium sp.]
MWCPSASLSVWANAWLAGAAAPDDVLDALSQWAPKHSVTAYDAVAAGNTGLPWPDLSDSGTVSLLQTLRTAAGPPASAPAISVVLPVPGDVRGLPAGSQFQRDAIAAGEAIVVAADPSSPAVGLVPDFEYDDSGPYDDADFEPELSGLCWTVYSLPTPPTAEHIELGEAEYALRSAVRSAADALGAIRAEAGGVDVADPRGLVEQVLDSSGRHRAPDHAPSRALRVLENAAHIDAIVTVSSGLMPIGLQSSSEAQIANDALRPLAAVVRSARSAALSAILYSAWRS